jgi:hypothetical protein
VIAGTASDMIGQLRHDLRSALFFTSGRRTPGALRGTPRATVGVDAGWSVADGRTGGASLWSAALMPATCGFALKKALTGEQEIADFSGDIRLAASGVAATLAHDN